VCASEAVAGSLDEKRVTATIDCAMRSTSWKAHFLSAAATSAVLLGFACGSSDVSSTTDGPGVGSIDASYPAELSTIPPLFRGNGDLSACSGPDAIVAASALEYAATLAHTSQFETMNDAQLTAVTAATRALLANDLVTANARAAGAGYSIAPLQFPTECLWALTPGLASPAGQATLVVRPRFQYDLALEAPHVPTDNHTDEEVALVFDILGAHVVIIEGAIRCAVSTPSGCHTNTQCETNGTAVQSDVAHAVLNAFQAMHVGTAIKPGGTRAIQFHSNLELALNGDATVSDGQRSDDSPITASLARALAGETGRDIRDCEDSVHPPQADEYCGDGNSQGLASNGAADTCQANASSASQLFFHVEQDTEDMVDYIGWGQKIASAIEATFAAVPLLDAGAPSQSSDANAPSDAGQSTDGGGADDD
jgi:hypothetical protein